MSGTRSDRRQRRSAGLVARQARDVCFTPGACLNVPEQIAAMRRRTHDGLIALTGPRRRSGVRWREFVGEAACREAFDACWGEENTTDPLSAGVFRRFFADYPLECVLVLAIVEVTPTAARLMGPS